MELKPHQRKASEQARELIDAHGLAYVFGAPRVGKSLIALNTFSDHLRVLVLTKKNAISGWEQYQGDYSNYDVTNYEQITKLNPANYSAVVIDEAHNFGTKPKPSQRIKDVRAFCKGKPILLLSGTPIVESPLSIYHQFALSDRTPLSYKNFYEFFRAYGVPDLTYIGGRPIESYKKARPELLEFIQRYFVNVTYTDAGFIYQNDDAIQWIEPSPEWLAGYAEIKRTSFLDSNTPLESASAQYQALHQYEGGVYKDGRKFKHRPKEAWLVDYCKAHAGERVAVMSYFIKEQAHLRALNIAGAEVFSSTKYCEGIDLSHFDRFILYSFGYSGAKFIQLRDRIVNLNKQRRTEVIIPLVKGGICAKIYECVKNKKDFNSSVFRGLK